MRLQLGSLRCEVAPERGGSVDGLWLDSTPVLRCVKPGLLLQQPLAGNFPLIPYSNRIADAVLNWHNQSHALTANNAPEPHAIHGVGWQRAWQVESWRADAMTLSLQHGADKHWPFAFNAQQCYSLQQNSLRWSMSLTNRATSVAPVGLGFHPYFFKRVGSRIAFSAQGIWDMDQRNLPLARRDCVGLDTCCDRLDIDHCFDRWCGVFTVHDDTLQVRVTSDLHYLVVFSRPGSEAIAVEPVSHVSNGMNAPHPDMHGVVSLAPGESMSAQLTIAARFTPHF